MLSFYFCFFCGCWHILLRRNLKYEICRGGQGERRGTRQKIGQKTISLAHKETFTNLLTNS